MGLLACVCFRGGNIELQTSPAGRPLAEAAGSRASALQMASWSGLGAAELVNQLVLLAFLLHRSWLPPGAADPPSLLNIPLFVLAPWSTYDQGMERKKHCTKSPFRIPALSSPLMFCSSLLSSTRISNQQFPPVVTTFLNHPSKSLIITTPLLIINNPPTAPALSTLLSINTGPSSSPPTTTKVTQSVPPSKSLATVPATRSPPTSTALLSTSLHSLHPLDPLPTRRRSLSTRLLSTSPPTVRLIRRHPASTASPLSTSKKTNFL